VSSRRSRGRTSEIVRKGRNVDTPQEERQFELAQESSGSTCSGRRGRRRANCACAPRPAPIPPLPKPRRTSGVYSGHVFALPEDKRITAAVWSRPGMIVEHLRVAG